MCGRGGEVTASVPQFGEPSPISSGYAGDLGDESLTPCLAARVILKVTLSASGRHARSASHLKVKQMS